MTFDEGLLLFEDHSIDLLHIDGCHTYEMVKHDFDSWFPKMSPSGVIILHDTTERQENFGVYKLWEEIETRFPFTLNFIHSHGLGLIFVNGFPFETTRQDNITNIFTRYYKLFSEKEKNFGILRKQKHQIDNFKTLLEEQSNKIIQLNITIQEQQSQKYSEQAQLNSELNQMNEKLNQIVTSRSWRITKPLRILSDFFWKSLIN